LISTFSGDSLISEKPDFLAGLPLIFSRALREAQNVFK
jgi:hypothetical protein